MTKPIPAWLAADYKGPTPPLDEFLTEYKADDNTWWYLASGHHLNLFDAALDQLEQARTENADLHREGNSLAAEVDDLRTKLAAAVEAHKVWAKTAQEQLADRDAATQRVRDRHAETVILDECEHDHPWSDVENGTAWADEEVGITCNVLYRACRECCISEGYQTEECANGHKWHHGPDGYRCRTLHALGVPDVD